jgi:hypothetical protein
MNRTKGNVFLRVTAVIANGVIMLSGLSGLIINKGESSWAEVTGLLCGLMVLDTALILLEPRYSDLIPDIFRSVAVFGNIGLLMVSGVMGAAEAILAKRGAQSPGMLFETLGAVFALLAAIILNMCLIRSKALWKKQKPYIESYICSQCGHIRGRSDTAKDWEIIYLGALGRVANQLQNQYQPCSICGGRESVPLDSREGQQMVEKMRKSGPSG